VDRITEIVGERSSCDLGVGRRGLYVGMLCRSCVRMVWEVVVEAESNRIRYCNKGVMYCGTHCIFNSSRTLVVREGEVI
jgi:hypothetical protein